MNLEALLAYLHLAAILAWCVFIGSQSALLRPEWLNSAALQRLARVERIAAAGAVLTLLTGLARMGLGMKGLAWYEVQPLLWVKLALFAAMFVGGWRAGRQVQRWARHHAAGGPLPAAAEVDALRKRLLGWSHLMLLVPVAAVMLARGLFTR
jgi:putative membrane protein